jgi:hypothetical protein
MLPGVKRKYAEKSGEAKKSPDYSGGFVVEPGVWLAVASKVFLPVTQTVSVVSGDIEGVVVFRSD